ncbi:MAG: hypothetical protein OXH65_13165 [Paracoccaceae bacterium]|nr:hypothetical protein [Paracoccaceae bacterium]MDE2676046.1 hypothetical protein [Paracoccaceae bacterium]MDE2738614.1 hypothetical protein [Paracoccaceae bacterium]MXZ50877.1 hypothetical protein [Paracoccaceae bacterium]MYF46862.1 hypothetical protein [Paracoccaceae bacterium]
MAIEHIEIATPFLGLRYVTDESTLEVKNRSIVLNVSTKPVRVEEQCLNHLQSAILANITLHDIEQTIIVDRFDAHENDEILCSKIRQVWPTAYEVRGEERLRGIEHYMSPKMFIDNLALTFYHSASVPLNVGLHKDHPFCPVPGFREVHTQIIGYGKMQQCRERDPATVYLEEMMAPGNTHRPMYDASGNYPWHQYDTITQSIFLAVEILPEGAILPEDGD